MPAPSVFEADTSLGAFQCRRRWEGLNLQPVPEGHKLTPAWLMLVFGDGSPTKQLAMITNSKFKVDVIGSKLVAEAETLPYTHGDVRAPFIRREVWLSNEQCDRLGHAVSLWHESDLRAFMPDPSTPIGASMAMQKLEVYRELLCVECGVCPSLAPSLCPSYPPDTTLLWSRTYRMWHGGRVITRIRETFSPALEQWMGPWGVPDQE